MDKQEILKLVENHKDSFVQIIKAKDKDFYNKINLDFNGQSFSEKLYKWSKLPDTVGFCIRCNASVKFLTFKEGCRKYCSTKCANQASVPLRSGSKARSLEYWQEKECLRCKNKFWSLKSKNQIYCSNKCSSNVTTNDPGRLNKIRRTKLLKYGNETYVNPSKARETCIKKYGVINPGQCENVKEKIRIVFLKKYLNKLKTSNRLKGLVIPLFNENDFISTFRTNQYSFQCKKCNNIFKDNLDDGRIPRCLRCFPILSGKSHGELEILEYIKSILPSEDIELNNRNIISPHELDIYISSKNIAIEYDGLFWHSELGGKKDRNYHLDKTIKCNEKGIRLIHIFEDEWFDKRNIVKERLRSMFYLNCVRIHARKCEIKELEYSSVEPFLSEYHIQKSVKSSINVGLFFNDELISMASFGKPRIAMGGANMKDYYELLRFCSKSDIIVRGNLSKLVTYFIRKYSPLKITSYADRRWNIGNSYEKAGFSKMGFTVPNYWYIKNGEIFRWHRFGFRKSILYKKLKNYDPNLSEWQNMQLNGYDRIWDCGNIKYEWNRPNSL
jgi:hypothetical protein